MPRPLPRIGAVAALASAFLVVTALAATSASARPFDARTQARLDATLRSTLQRSWSPGVIAGVWMDGRAWTQTAGLTSRTGGGRPVRTLYTRIASITKTFTGTLILQLVDEGRLSLDDTIDRWFPTFPNASSITVRQLGTMSSGIASYTADSAVGNQYLGDPTAPWTPTQLIDAAATLPPLFAPGEGFDYSNTNFVMLGQIVEQVTGQPFATVLRQKILRPLRMTHTSFPATTQIPSPHWTGYTIQGASTAPLDATGWNPTFAGAAGQMISTLHDLRIWTRALGTGSLLEPATQKLRLTPNSFSSAGGRSYAFAVGVDHGWISHSGELPGFSTQVAYLPSAKASIVIMANSDVASAEGTTAPQLLSALARVLTPAHVPTG